MLAVTTAVAVVVAVVEVYARSLPDDLRRWCVYSYGPLVGGAIGLLVRQMRGGIVGAAIGFVVGMLR